MCVLTVEFRADRHHFRSYCLSDKKVALTGKIKTASGTDVSSFLSLPISLLRRPWDTDTHLERIVNGIDTVPGLIKNELSCCDVNTKWPEPSCICLDSLWSLRSACQHWLSSLSILCCFHHLQINKICKSIDWKRLGLNSWNASTTKASHEFAPSRYSPPLFRAVLLS